MQRGCFPAFRIGLGEIYSKGFTSRLKPYIAFLSYIEKERLDMPKMYKGNPPDLAEGWEKIGECKDGEGVTWLMFRKPQDHDDEWSTYKICAKGAARSKGNYWAVRKDTGQLGFARDMASMREHRPELHAFVERMMSQHS
jgi:hypothetical protein